MPKARYRQMSLDVTPYYHCTSRCVRRAFLCGVDGFTGKSYEHRRQWVEDRILLLAEAFAIDVCAYAVMSNHLHLVLHVNKALAESLTPLQVVERWHRLYKGTLLTQRFLSGEGMSMAEQDAVDIKIALWRKQLMDISWFMRALNEPIARQANAEDQCTGKFWEARYTSQALLDETALLACMAYVDLNPIRAMLAETPETSDHTSIKLRLGILQAHGQHPPQLAPFVGGQRQDHNTGLAFELKDYLELVDWTGRAVRTDKRGAINQSLPPILERLQIPAHRWLKLSTLFKRQGKSLVGPSLKVRLAAECLGYQRAPGLGSALLYFP
ncbi:transposase [Halioxenophilus sp. WMMB6]|uniref:transposase n=1 Tax=Halioxenophilus sp. WMMB6 TaxID=3073815 RepID=UPI00295E4413|nr:transposase [Halioxenophilus sp. WMMB6]